MIKAPFNFVPLSDKVYFPDWADQISHDIPFEDGEDGTITLEITNKTPLFVRDGHKKGEDTQWSCHVTDMEGNKNYFIPATTLKGCFRSVMEIVSFSKLNLFDNASFGYRSFTPQIKGVNYQQDMQKVNSCGWLYQEDNKFFIDECVEGIQKIRHTDLKSFFPSFNAGKDHETAEVKQRSLSHELYPTIKVESNQITYKQNNKERHVNAGAYKVVCTGFMAGKKVEYLFSENTQKIAIEDNIFQVFDTIHQYTPYYAGRNGKDGVLKSTLKKGGKIPVFFEKKNDIVVSMGITGMYKYPFRHSIWECVKNTSKDHFSTERDMAESIFGCIGDASLKGRVHIGHAYATEQIGDEECIVTQGVLGQPRPSYYPLYLKQSNGVVSNYSSENPRIAGRKRYRITQNGEIIPLSTGNDNEKIQTAFRPLPQGKKFVCKIRVHNLKKVEIGALLSSITFNNTEGAFHNIGLAKSFGYGAFNCNVTLSDNMKHSAQEYINAFNEEISYFLQQKQSCLDKEECLSTLVSIASATHSAEDMKHMNFDECNVYKEDRNYSVLTEKKKHFNIAIDETSVIQQKITEQTEKKIKIYKILPHDEAIDKLTSLKLSITGIGMESLVEKVGKELADINEAKAAIARELEIAQQAERLRQIEENQNRKLNAGMSFLLENKVNSDELKISLLSNGIKRIKDFIKRNTGYALTPEDLSTINEWIHKLPTPKKKGDLKDITEYNSDSWKELRKIAGEDTASEWHKEINNHKI